MKRTFLAIAPVAILAFGCAPEPQQQLEAIRLGEDAAIHSVRSGFVPDYEDWAIVNRVSLPLADNAREMKLVSTYHKVAREMTKAEHDSAAIDLFFNLGTMTDGQAYSAKNALAVISTITTIINKHAESGSDIVFLIDKTGSMSDDISTLRTNLHYIISILEDIPNVRLGVAFYADMNVDSNWFDLVPLGDDFTGVKDALSDIRPVGGGDQPESVNDGIYRTLEEMNWSSTNKRMILVLGDAANSPRSERSLEEVVSKCVAAGVKVNLFPVLIDITSGNSRYIIRDGIWENNIGSGDQPRPEPEGLISQLYPNPATDAAILSMTTSGDYRIEMYTITGSLVLDKKLTGDSYTIDCSHLAAGQYVIRVSSPISKLFGGKNLIVQH